MTPIQQAIEQVNKEIAQLQKEKDTTGNRDYRDIVDHAYIDGRILSYNNTLTSLQSLLPVEKEFIMDAYDEGFCHSDNGINPDFEQYYSQFNEVK